MAYRRKGIGQCDYVTNPGACGPSISPTGTVIGGSDALSQLQTDPYVTPLGTSPANNTLAVAAAGLSANLGTWLVWGAVAIGGILLLKAVR